MENKWKNVEKGKRGTSRREEEKYKLGNEESKVYERKKIREGQLK